MTGRCGVWLVGLGLGTAAAGVWSLSSCARASPAALGDTLLVEGFESGHLKEWQDGADPARQRVLNDPALARTGNHVLEVTYPPGRDGGWLTRWFMPGYDSVAVSLWVRLGPGWRGGTKLVALYGSRVDNRWSGMGQAGRCPTGSDFFAAMLVTEPDGDPGPVRFYTYYPAMAREPDVVTCWGRYGDGTETYVPPLILTPDAWHHLTFAVKLNTPGQANANQIFWLDGVERGRWSGFSLRSHADLRLNSVQLSFNAAGGAPQLQTLYVDDMVVLTRRDPSAGGRQ